ncbi:uncharacterized protein EKO05_0009848 [Ascochyta rabiei]|uniref:Uncharacterized protein n=1 Tax=Didymella rabiei TaxID=5454 RepID=A0A163GZ23_DIDRA|nr:uncharacterized protein EKO05_0009848 [Ascochyta rabiei]KZM25077.1 hypothetical protein ST47_g3766 [Ascochyta rabiei]UPX19589.1 hypothetical protein EKO05_0009848 [Ascochyta rabiei]
MHANGSSSKRLPGRLFSGARKTIARKVLVAKFDKPQAALQQTCHSQSQPNNSEHAQNPERQAAATYPNNGLQQHNSSPLYEDATKKPTTLASREYTRAVELQLTLIQGDDSMQRQLRIWERFAHTAWDSPASEKAQRRRRAATSGSSPGAQDVQPARTHFAPGRRPEDPGLPTP